MYWLLLACTGADPVSVETEWASEDPVVPGVGQLLIEELYTCGAPPAGGTDHYFSDQFVELVNAADVPLDLSGVLIADVFGSAGRINAGMAPDSFRDERPDEVVLSTVWRIPDGVTLEPGKTLVIAHDGANHRPFSSVDLSGAGLEAFVARSGNDDDSPTVDNLEEVYFNGGYDWLMTVFGPSVVVLSAGTALEDVPGPYSTLHAAPVDAVLDGVDTLMDDSSRRFKRLPDSVDQGYTYVSGTYVGESVRRKRNGAVWQDTDDSSEDFEVGVPSPSFESAEGTVGADTWLELGTGALAFEPLADGADVELVAGLQGGYHVDVALQFGGFGPGGVQLVYDAVDPDTAERVSFETQGTVTDSSVTAIDDGWERVGDRVVLDVSGPGEVVGRELILRVTAALSGSTWSDERRVRVVDDE